MKWLPDSSLDFILDNIATSDEEVVCNAQPQTFFNAVWPDLWAASLTYIIGDLVHPPTQNGFVYECILGGDSGATEPGWGTAQDQEFIDGTVTWITHSNYALANVSVGPDDFVKSDAVSGRVLTVAEKSGIVTHTAGTVVTTAFINTVSKELNFVTDASTTVVENNDIEQGRTTIFFTFDITVEDPS